MRTRITGVGATFLGKAGSLFTQVRGLNNDTFGADPATVASAGSRAAFETIYTLAKVESDAKAARKAQDAKYAADAQYAEFITGFVAARDYDVIQARKAAESAKATAEKAITNTTLEGEEHPVQTSRQDDAARVSQQAVEYLAYLTTRPGGLEQVAADHDKVGGRGWVAEIDQTPANPKFQEAIKAERAKAEANTIIPGR